MKIKGKKVKSGKPQHLEPGKVYDVDEATAKQIVENGQGELVAKKAPTKKK